MAGAAAPAAAPGRLAVLIAIHALLSSGRAADHPVYHDGERFVPWREFAGAVAARAARFAQRAERRWLLTSEQPHDFAISMLALLHAGKTLVVPPNTQPGTLARLAGAYDALAGPGADAQQAPHGPSAMTLAAFDPQAAHIELYTSGSAGEPKCVHKTLAQFETEVSAQESLWGAALGDAAIVATSPHQHIYGLLFRLLWPLSAGRPFDSVTCDQPDTLAQRLARLGAARACALVSSPAQLSRLPELIPLASLRPPPRIIFSSGGPLPAAAAVEFHRQLGFAPTEIFGSTETGGIAWRRQAGGETGDAWTPLPGIAVAAAPDGALSLRSPFLAGAGAWRMDDAIEALAGGRFRLRGRLDRTVKIEDKRLSLADLEARLGEHPWVAAAAAVALAGRRQSVGAALVLNARGREQLAARGRAAVVQQLRGHLAAHFEKVLLPRRWRFPERLPFDQRGKLPQAALSALFAVANDESAPAPRARRKTQGRE
jgi:acyl-coenzyme A synthetase/AMP-(fatty) acid ligase